MVVYYNFYFKHENTLFFISLNACRKYILKQYYINQFHVYFKESRIHRHAHTLVVRGTLQQLAHDPSKLTGMKLSVFKAFIFLLPLSSSSELPHRTNGALED